MEQHQFVEVEDDEASEVVVENDEVSVNQSRKRVSGFGHANLFGGIEWKKGKRDLRVEHNVLKRGKQTT